MSALAAEPSAATHEDADRDAATKALVLTTAERLFAERGLRCVSVRDITAEAGVNLASVNYHFGSKDTLVFEIFRRRAAELSRDRARMLHEAQARHGGQAPVREILAALMAPPLLWSRPGHPRRIAMQFIIRARGEGGEAVREAVGKDVSHLRPFVAALIAARPDLPPEEVHWRLHFVLGMVHNNRVAEFERLHVLSEGLTRDGDTEALLNRMLDFAEAGFLR
ncbi:MAG: TetR family transcriptional regulator [Alphaproteobacteria bacterium]|jgi:AcrR family transcriptional regulator|nr:TetR family transcriptional regulator [Alphaproteobacteria bacterium]